MDNIEEQLMDQIRWNEQDFANGNFDNDVDEEDDRDGEGSIDGGVARGADETTDRKSRSECDLVRLRHVDISTCSTWS